jgi:hypothetical protein
MLVSVASRLALDAYGRPIVVVTATSEAALHVGQRFLILGNDLPAVSDKRFGWLGRNGSRRPTLEEAAAAEAGVPRVRLQGAKL